METTTMKPLGFHTAKTAGLPLLTYHEDGFEEIKKVWLTDEEYGRVLQSKVIANVDIVLFNEARKIIYLAWRVAKPMVGWWYMGGNTGNINLPLHQGLQKVLAREIGFTIPEERIALKFIGEYFWKDRAQEPQNLGCHICGLTFAAPITDEEVKEIRLDPKEYLEGKIREFSREELVCENVFPAIVDAYDFIFPPETLHHIVLISFKPNTSESIMQDIFDRYQTLDKMCGGKEAGILLWKVKKNMDLRKNVHLVEIAEFINNDSLQAFRRHPEHQKIANDLSKVADWQVGDIMY